MLPAYLGYFMGLDSPVGNRRTVVRRGLVNGVVVSAGFFAIFGLAGALLVVGAQAVRSIVPWMALLIGLGLIGLGIALVRGRYITFRIPTVRRVAREHSYSSLLVFGISYAIASLSCTLPVFLSVVVGTFITQSFLEGFAAFLAYAMGMSFLLIGVTLALALGRDSLVTRLRASARYVNPISGVVLVLAGAFVVFYWSVVLFTGAENLNNFAVTRLVESFSAWATQLIGTHPLALGIALGVGVAAAIVSGRRRSRPTGLPTTSRTVPRRSP